MITWPQTVTWRNYCIYGKMKLEISCWKMERDCAHRPSLVGCHRVSCCLPFCLPSTWNFWVRLSISMDSGTTNMLMIPSCISQHYTRETVWSYIDQSKQNKGDSLIDGLEHMKPFLKSTLYWHALKIQRSCGCCSKVQQHLKTIYIGWQPCVWTFVWYCGPWIW